MLQIKSHLRRKLLTFYFSNIDASCYVRELARKLSVDPTNLSRELHALARQGLFIIEERGNQKYFRLNTHHPLFQELKTMISKTIGVISILKESFAKLPSVELALLYGSFAKGEEDAASDIDVLLVSDIEAAMIAETVRSLEEILGREVNVTSYSPQEFSRKRKKDDPFLQSVLQGRYEILCGQL